MTRAASIVGTILLAVMAATTVRGEVLDGDAAKADPSATAMQGFAAAMSKLEPAIESKDSAVLAEASKRIVAIAERDLSSAFADDSTREEYAARQPQLIRLGREIAGLADERKWRHASEALDELRVACGGCHFKVRPDNSERGSFPLRGGAIWGYVNVSTHDGIPRENRSGVVVFLDGIAYSRPDGVAPRRRRVSQRNRIFTPRVLPILEGTTVDFPNDDRVFHNVFSRSRTKHFDLDIYATGESKSVEFTKPGLVQLYCNIHPSMSASILVLGNPWYAVTDESGFFLIAGFSPTAEASLRTWSELGSDQRKLIDLKPSRVQRIDLDVREIRPNAPHLDKFGRPYRSRGKYR